MKRLFALFLAVVLCGVCMVPAQVQAVEGLTYEVVDGKATVTGYDGELTGTLDIPATIENYPVTAIAPNAFFGTEGLERVNIPKSVTGIGEYAFGGCPSLTGIFVDSKNTAYASDDAGVLMTKDKTQLIQAPGAITGYTMASTVTTVREGAFYNCRKLTQVTMGSKVSVIEDFAFGGTALQTLTLGNTVTKIGDFAFAYCRDLTQLTLGSKLTTIGDYAFGECYALTQVTIPAAVTQIGDLAFAYCHSLTGIFVDGKNTAYASDEAGVLMNKDKTLLIQAPGALTVYTMPEGVTTVAGSAFREIQNLTEVTLASTVGQIGAYAFEYCDNLDTVVFLGDAPEIHAQAFTQVTAKAYYPKDNDTWTQEVKGNYGGKLSWRPGLPTDLTGDINGDDVIDNEDVATLLWYTLFPEDYVICGHGDFTGDGMVNNEDVAYLLWHTLFPADYPIG